MNFEDYMNPNIASKDLSDEDLRKRIEFLNNGSGEHDFRIIGTNILILDITTLTNKYTLGRFSDEHELSAYELLEVAKNPKSVFLIQYRPYLGQGYRPISSTILLIQRDTPIYNDMLSAVDSKIKQIGETNGSTLSRYDAQTA